MRQIKEKGKFVSDSIQKRISSFFLLFCLLLILSGCKTELWIGRSGAGNGIFEVPSGVVSKSQIVAELEKQGLKVTSTEEKNGNIKVQFQWSDFNKAVIRQRIVNKNGTIFLDFGFLDGSTEFIVHIPGKVLETSGTLINPSTVQFGYGEANLTYRPQSLITPAIGIIVLSLLIVIFLVVGVSSLTKKKSVVSTMPSQVVFCPQCGAKNSLDAKFCTQCGTLIKKE